MKLRLIRISADDVLHEAFDFRVQLTRIGDRPGG
jgi:hypothetical protein